MAAEEGASPELRAHNSQMIAMCLGLQRSRIWPQTTKIFLWKSPSQYMNWKLTNKNVRVRTLSPPVFFSNDEHVKLLAEDPIRCTVVMAISSKMTVEKMRPFYTAVVRLRDASTLDLELVSVSCRPL